MAAKNVRPLEFKLGRLGLTLFIAGMSILLFSAFIFGVMVGKDIENYPEKIARRLPQSLLEKIGLASGGKPATVAVSPGSPGSVPEQSPQMDLTFYDTLTKKRGDEKGVISEKEIDKHLPGEGNKSQTMIAAPPPAAPSFADKPKENRTSPVQSKAADSVQSPEKKVTPSAADKPNETKKENYLIQVASYKEKGKADAISKKLKALGYHPKVIAVDLPSKGKWHRIILSGFPSQQQAQKTADIIKKKMSGLNCIIRKG